MKNMKLMIYLLSSLKVASMKKPFRKVVAQVPRDKADVQVRANHRIQAEPIVTASQRPKLLHHEDRPEAVLPQEHVVEAVLLQRNHHPNVLQAEAVLMANLALVDLLKIDLFII